MTVDYTNPVSQSANGSDPEKIRSLRTIVTVVYALQAIAFFVGITSIVGIVINYLKLSDAQGTWLASHFRWQMRTFWFSLLWFIVGFITTFILIGYVILFANVIWMIYRVAKGWLRLNDNKPMYEV
tara:strand:- start:610 stop:987 length:378 start_codon:yes stop_codon:yes gene_type:complete